MTLPEQLADLLPPGESRRFGELLLACADETSYRAIHIEDEMADSLTLLTDISAARDWGKFDSADAYRPLRTAPGLRRGFEIRCETPTEFLAFLDAIYPGCFATWIRYRDGETDPVSLRATLDRQTGMYRRAGAITDQMANKIMRNLCGKGCLRRIAWPIDDRCAVGKLPPPRRSVPLVCTEACTFAVSEARRLVKEAYDRANAPS